MTKISLGRIRIVTEIVQEEIDVSDIIIICQSGSVGDRQPTVDSGDRRTGGHIVAVDVSPAYSATSSGRHILHQNGRLIELVDIVPHLACGGERISRGKHSLRGKIQIETGGQT